MLQGYKLELKFEYGEPLIEVFRSNTLWAALLCARARHSGLTGIILVGLEP